MYEIQPNPVKPGNTTNLIISALTKPVQTQENCILRFVIIRVRAFLETIFGFSPLTNKRDAQAW